MKNFLLLVECERFEDTVMVASLKVELELFWYKKLKKKYLIFYIDLILF